MERIVTIDNANTGIVTRTVTQGAELDLVKEFRDYKFDSFKRKKKGTYLAVFNEPQIDGAYPDIIFAEYNIKCFDSWNEARFLLNSQDLKLLYHLFSTAGVGSTEIVKQLGINKSTLLISIEKLLDAKLIKRKCGYWCADNFENFFAVRKIETVEAKLKQWDSALKQAVHNTRFSSESYVLSELKTKPNTNTMQKFSTSGIGVYLKNDSGFNLIKKAKKIRYSK